jgi:phosphoribosylanthranilate isomerase
VKICGITREEDLAVAVDAGADAVGFLVGVPASPRNLTIERAKLLMSKAPIFVDTVVVTAPKDVEIWLQSVKIKAVCDSIHGTNILLQRKQKKYPIHSCLKRFT